MSAPSKTNTPAPSTSKRDWVGATTDELKSGSDNEPEIYDTKVGERKQCRQVKEKEAREHQQREEAECRAREEAVCLEREAGRGGEEGPGGRRDGEAVGGGRGLKTKVGHDEEAGEGGERSGQAQWNAGTRTSVSLVFINFDFADFFF